MLYTIYLVYVDSIKFLWRNLYIFLPLYIHTALSWFLTLTIVGNSISERFIKLFPLALIIAAQVFICLIIYNQEVLPNSKLNMSLFKNAFKKGIKLFLFVTFITFGFGFLLAFINVFISQNIPNIISIFFIINCLIACLFGLTHQIFFINNSIVLSVKNGLIDFYQNLLFYALIIFLYILLVLLSRLQTISLLFSLPFFLIFGENNSITQFVTNFLYSTLSTFQIVVLSFSILYKNRDKLPIKSEIVN